MGTLTDNNKKVTIVHVHNFLKMPFVRLYTNLSKDKLPAKFMTLMCQEMAPLLNKDPNLFNWIFETDKCMSKGPDSEGKPYIWMEIRALKAFDSKEDCGNLIPKIFEKVTNLSGLSKEQIHILVGPVTPFQIGVNGEIKG